jgi:hypothetical protein
MVLLLGLWCASSAAILTLMAPLAAGLALPARIPAASQGTAGASADSPTSSALRSHNASASTAS